MNCTRCSSERIGEICGKSSDCNSGHIAGKRFDGYVPCDVGIGGGDYIEFDWCLECGQIQGVFPVAPLDEE